MFVPRSAVPSGVPDSNGRHLIQNDDDHHGSRLVICTAVTVFALIFITVIRLYIRGRVLPPFGIDDTLLFSSVVAGLLESALVFAEVHFGFGTAMDLIPPSNLRTAEIIGYVANIVFVAALYLSKYSLVFFYLRTSRVKAHNKVARIVLKICAAFGVISVLITALQCSPKHPWRQMTGECSRASLIGTWSTLIGLDAISELFLFGLCLQLVWNLQTTLGKKSSVVFAFSIRLPMIALAALRLYYLIMQIRSPDPTFIGTTAAILTQVEQVWGVATATIPCYKPLTKRMTTSWGVMNRDTVINRSAVSDHSDQNQNNARPGNGAPAPAPAIQNVPMARIRPGDRYQAVGGVHGAGLEVTDFSDGGTGHLTSVTGGSGSHPISARRSSDSLEATSRHINIRKKMSWSVLKEPKPKPEDADRVDIPGAPPLGYPTPDEMAEASRSAGRPGEYPMAAESSERAEYPGLSKASESEGVPVLAGPSKPPQHALVAESSKRTEAPGSSKLPEPEETPVVAGPSNSTEHPEQPDFAELPKPAEDTESPNAPNPEELPAPTEHAKEAEETTSTPESVEDPKPEPAQEPTPTEASSKTAEQPIAAM